MYPDLASDQTAARELAAAVFSAVDRQDADVFSQFFTPEGVFVFGNGAEIRGRDAIRTAVAGFFDAIAGLKHEITDVWNCGNTLITRIAVTYTRLDGSCVTLPGANIWTLQGGKIGDYRIYIDLTPLFSPSRQA